MLNMDDIYNMHSVMSREEATGEALDDAIYNRNRLIEEKFDIEIEDADIHDFVTVGDVVKYLETL